MPGKRFLAAGVVVVGILGCSGSPSPTINPAPASTTIPTQAPSTITIPLAQQSSTNPSPVIMMSVGGGPPVPVLLDTGSAGLRIFSDSVGANVVRSATNLDLTFGGGTTYAGALATTTELQLGSTAFALPKPLAFQIVDRICPGINGTPDCTQNVIPKVETGGKFGILGVRPDITQGADAPIFSPLAVLPGNLNSGFIVSLHNGTDETLTVGLTPANTQGFQTFPVPVGVESDGISHGWTRVAFPWCVAVPNRLAPTCVLNGLLADTGTTFLDMALPSTNAPAGIVDTRGTILPGTTIITSYGGVTWTFVAGRCGSYDTGRIEFVSPGHGGGGFGILPYFYNDVLYDVTNGRYGYRPYPTLTTPGFCST